LAVGGFSAEGASGTKNSKGVPTSARIAGGAIVEREVGSELTGSSRSNASYRVVEQQGDLEMTPSGNAVVLEEELINVSETVMDHRITANLNSMHINMIRMVLGRTG